VKFEGRVVSVAVEHIQLPNGFEARHEILTLPRAVAVVPLLEEAGHPAEVVLVEQFRSSVRGYIHEVPAGIVEAGEEPEVCAVRELKEETGFACGRMTHLTTLYPIPGTSAHFMDFFLAQDLRPGEQELDASECLTVKRFAFDDLLASLLPPLESGGAPVAGPPRVIVDSKTHLGLLHVALLRLQPPGEGGRT
jgi:ADP-ribose pyrophosphatase